MGNFHGGYTTGNHGERNRPGGPTKAGDQPSGIQSFLGCQMDGITTGWDGIQDGSSSPHRFVEVVFSGWMGILSVQCPQYKDGIFEE